MKTSLLTSIFVLLFGLTYAQNNQQRISGRVLSEDGKPVQAANVALLKDAADTLQTIVSLTTTDSDGRFAIDNPGELRPLRISCVGYATKTLLVAAGDLGDIVLPLETQQVDEVTVTALGKRYRPDGITYYPTTQRIEASENGMALLSAMNPPRVNIDPLNYAISALGGGEVVLLINNRPVSTGEVQGTPPQYIKRIEYYDQPTPRFPQATIVINVVVERPHQGGSVTVNLVEGILGNYGEHYVYASVHKGDHSLSLDWQPQYRYSHNQRRERTDHFYLPTDTIQRIEQAMPADHIYWNNLGTLHYGYDGKHLLLDLSANGRFNRTWNNDFNGQVLTQSRLRNDTTLNRDHSAEQLKSGWLNTYMEVRTPLGPLYLNANYGQTDETYEREFEERNMRDSLLFGTNSSTNEKMTFSGFQWQYGLPFPLNKKMTCFGMIMYTGEWRGSWHNNTYTTPALTYNASGMKRTQGKHTIMLMLNFNKKLTLVGGALNMWNKYTIADSLIHSKRWMPCGAIEYIATEWWRVALDVMLQMKSPGLESIAPIDMPLDPYQMQRSNAQLRDGAMQQYTLNNTVQLGEKIELFAQAKLQRYQNKVASTSHIDPALNMVLRTTDNIPSFERLSLNASLSGRKLADEWVSFNLWGGVDFYNCDGGQLYKLRRALPHCNGSLTLSKTTPTKRTYSLRSELWYGQENYLDGELLSTSSLSTRFTLSYQHKQLRLSAGIMNPFMHYKDVRRESLSSVAPYVRYAYNQMYNNLVFVQINYTFGWGTEHNSGSNKLHLDEGESAVVRSKR